MGKENIVFASFSRKPVEQSFIFIIIGQSNVENSILKMLY